MILGTIKFALFYTACMIILYGAARVFLAIGDSFLGALLVAVCVILAIGFTFAFISRIGG